MQRAAVTVVGWNLKVDKANNESTILRWKYWKADFDGLKELVLEWV